MRLLNDATSPFGRKVMMAVLSRRIDVAEEFVDLNSPGQILPFNPLGQIPVLVLEHGRAVYDSQSIMSHIDECHSGPRLIPAERRAQILTTMSLCDGLMEATLQRLLETRRPGPQQSAELIAKLELRIRRGLAALEAAAPEILARSTQSEDTWLGSDFAALAALGYADFRHSQEWRAYCPQLAAWYAANADRALVRDTAPTRTFPASLR